ncbi:MAG: MBL fold metallo-hydrolase [Halobacteriota archaeon]|nr:MBL fold metallo-hydrolase [Halobacteriota archaeon]
MARVKVIKEGHLRLMGGIVAGGSSTVTLVDSDKKIIVDTGVSRDRREIISGLEKEGLKPEDIDIVINTHPHGDHTGNNNLFSSATVFDNWDSAKICDGVEMIHTPGHTKNCYSVLVETDKGKVAIVGDLISLEDDLVTGRRPHSFDFKLQKENRKKILEIADYIVVGHGGLIQN